MKSFRQFSEEKLNEALSPEEAKKFPKLNKQFIELDERRKKEMLDKLSKAEASVKLASKEMQAAKKKINSAKSISLKKMSELTDILSGIADMAEELEFEIKRVK